MSEIDTPEYKAAQVAGSCRLSGIKVSPEQEKLIARIIAGEVSAQDEIRKYKERLKKRLSQDRG